MAEINPNDLNELAKVLENAKMHLDAVTRAPGGISGVGRLPALADNNSGCNTSCSCGAAELSPMERIARSMPGGSK